MEPVNGPSGSNNPIRKYLVPVLLLALVLFILKFNYDLLTNQNNHQAPELIAKPAENSIKSFEIEKIWDYDFKQLRALAVDNFDNVYVAESYTGPGSKAGIFKFNQEGELLGWWGKGNKTSGWHDASSTEVNIGNGNAKGEFNYIFKIAFDNQNNMFVIDRGEFYDQSSIKIKAGPDRIQRFDENGSFISWLREQNGNFGWHKEVVEPEQKFVAAEGLSEPSCIIVENNSLIVGNYLQNRIDKFNLDKGVLEQWFGKGQDGNYGWHKAGSGPGVAAPHFGDEIGAFNGPIDCNLYGNELYVVSYYSNPVVAIFDYRSGKYLRGYSHNEGHKPQELIVDKFGNLIFSDNYQGNIKFFDTNRKLTTQMQLGPGGDYFAVGDFAFDSKGGLYFSEQQKNKVYKLKLIYE